MCLIKRTYVTAKPCFIRTNWGVKTFKRFMPGAEKGNYDGGFGNLEKIGYIHRFNIFVKKLRLQGGRCPPPFVFNHFGVSN